MNRWLDRLTLSQRKLVFIGVAVTLVGLGAFSFRLAPSPPPGVADPATPLVPKAQDVARDLVVVEGQQAGGATTILSEADIAAAQAVAERFAVEYATRRWDEPPPARIARMSDLMSADLAVAFSSDSGAAALEQERTAIREIAEGRLEFSYPQTISRDRVVFTIVVFQTVSSTKGTQARRPSYQIVVAPLDSGWRVVDLVA